MPRAAVPSAQLGEPAAAGELVASVVCLAPKGPTADAGTGTWQGNI